MKLYNGPVSMFGAKAEIAMREKELDCEVELVPFNLQTRYDPKHPEVLRINPKKQVPVLVDGDLELFDSTQIFEYFEDIKPEPALWPRDPKARARARLIELRSDEIFFGEVMKVINASSRTAPETLAAMAATNALYPEMEKFLMGDYFAEEFSYADIAFYMAQFYAALLGMPMPDSVPKLVAWRNRVAARPSVQLVTGRTWQFIQASRALAAAQ
ncbi:MAG TPA: glutathione S-transferase family protein [Rhizomicrobium sp.]|jgi:glutathione S-transferase|nr:glutathione S-transferase family protein [Rhizomicrobium sp.]